MQLRISSLFNICSFYKTLSDRKMHLGIRCQNLNPGFTKNHRRTVRTVRYSSSITTWLQHHTECILIIAGGVPNGNQGFIRATKFMGLVARFLKLGQPGFYFFLFRALNMQIFFLLSLLLLLIIHFLLLLGCLKWGVLYLMFISHSSQ